MVNSQMTSDKADYVEAMGYCVYSDKLFRIPLWHGKARVLNTISPNSYGLATRNRQLEEALKASDYLVLDGVYFALASILLKGKNIRRNQGPDVFYHFMERLNKRKGTAFFLGSTPATLRLIRQQAGRRYPYLCIHTYSPPFVNEFSAKDNAEMIAAINEVKPDIVFIGMTCPKQEIWSIRNREKLTAGLVICIGNVFDWFAGTQKSIHPLWFKLRLGWLVRIFLRPEIFRRNIGNQLRFFRDLLLILLGIRRRSRFEAEKIKQTI